MKQQTTNILTAVLLASCSALPVLSYGDDEVYELDDYVVSGKVLYTDEVNALKTPTPIIDVPQSLSILTASQISEQGFDSIGDIIDYTPGVNTSQGEGHRDQRLTPPPSTAGSHEYRPGLWLGFLRFGGASGSAGERARVQASRSEP